ncbi:MAG: hypothetical protein U0797_00890 [Gemmataceae bacterium]
MADRVSNMIWCENCAEASWCYVTRWRRLSWAVTRSGTLKEPAECSQCNAELLPGDRAEAITYYLSLPESARWMQECLDFDCGSEHDDD